MPNRSHRFSVFTKPWKALSLTELAAHVRDLGFDGIELPVRPGFQVTPERVASDLATAARTFAAENLAIYSVAGTPDEATIAACAEAGVPCLRVMAQICAGEDYLDAEARLAREYDALLPLLDRYDVTLGVQNHCDRFVASGLGLMRIIARYDPRRIAVVWDAAHEALNGGLAEYALDVVWSHLHMVNLKNAYWRRVNGPEASQAEWRHYWTSGRHGLASWPEIARQLVDREYQGVICLTAEYSDEALVDDLVAEDLAYARTLFARQ